MSEITRLLWIRLFIFSVWLTLAAGGIAIVDPETDSAVLGVVLLGATAGLGILRPFPGSHVALAALSAVLYAGLQGVRATAEGADPDAPYLPAAGVGAFGIVLTAMIADSIRNSLLAYDDELSIRQRVIEDLESVDPATGALKRPHAERLIAAEVDRARRYARNLTLIVCGPDNWDDIVTARGQEAAERIVAEAGQAYLATMRVMDRVIHLQGPDFGVFMPETGLEGGLVVAEKLCELGSELFRTQVRAGIAGFPEDDVTGSGLMAEAEEALEFARIAQITVASRSLLT
jgi:GGDEF domain-containing protein